MTAAASLRAALAGGGTTRGIAAPIPGASSGIGSLVRWTKWVPFPLAVSSVALVSAASFCEYSNVATGLNASFRTAQTMRIRAVGLAEREDLALGLAGALAFFLGL